MITQQFIYYVGENNNTKQLETDKIKAVLNKAIDGYTLSRAVGFWKGTEEKTAIIKIVGINKNKAEQIAKDLKRELQQNSVLLETTFNQIKFI